VMLWRLRVAAVCKATLARVGRTAAVGTRLLQGPAPDLRSHGLVVRLVCCQPMGTELRRGSLTWSCCSVAWMNDAHGCRTTRPRGSL
jgi:hypothetical protein